MHNHHNIGTLKEFKEAFQAEVEGHLRHKFAWGNVQQWVDHALETFAHDIVLANLGLEKDSFSRGLRFSSGNRGAVGLLERLNELIENYIDQRLDDLMTQALAHMEKKGTVREIKATAKKYYEEEFQRQIRNYIAERARQQAKIDAEEFVSRKAEGYWESLKMKLPLKLGTLQEAIESDG